MLFNISNDPHEQNDIKALYPEICQKGAKYILDWHDDMMLCSDSTIDPLWTVLSEGGPHHAMERNLHGYIKRLRETSRKDGADKLCEKYNC